jgi:hypothetical protein
MIQLPLSWGEHSSVELRTDDERASIRARAVGGSVAIHVEPTKDFRSYSTPVAGAHLTQTWQTIQFRGLPEGTRGLRIAVQNASANSGAFVEIDDGAPSVEPVASDIIIEGAAE